MKAPLRLRYFIWLAIALGIFILIQLLAWFLWEFWEYSTGKDEIFSQEMGELLVVVGINLVCIPFMLAFLWYLSRRMLKPLQVINATAKRISQGQLKERIAVEQQEDELGILASTLNDAFNRYQSANEKLYRFGGDASHQLRTPLTSMRSAGEICLSRERSTEEYRHTIESMLEDAKDLTGIIERLLLLARLETSDLQKHFQPLQLSDITNQAAEKFRPSCEDKHINLDVIIENEASIQGDASLLEQVLANLLDNAIRFTPEHGRIQIHVDLSLHGNSASITIQDNGPGIPIALRDRVFDRFKRDQSQPGSGAGLGLAIVKEIIQVHGGNVTLETPESGGARFRITIPLS